MEDAFSSAGVGAVSVAGTVEGTGESWFTRVVRWSLYAIAIVAPLIFFSGVTPPVYAKQVFVVAFAMIAAVGYLAGALVQGRIWYQRSITNLTFLLLLVGWLVSGLFSGLIQNSLWGSDVIGERWLGFLAFGIIFFIVQSLGEHPARTLLRVLLYSGGALIFFSLINLFAPSWTSFLGLGDSNTTLLGNAYSLGALIGLYFVLLLGGFLTGWVHHVHRIERVILGVTLVASFLILLGINHRPVWFSLIPAVAVLLALVFRGAGGEISRGKIGLLVGLIVVLGAFSLFSIHLPFLTLPSEVAPSYAGTLSIAAKTLKEHALFGSGPGTFGLDYARFHDSSVNQTAFWGIRFNTGAGFVPTALATTGIVGFLLLLSFIASVLYTLVRSRAFRRGGDPLVIMGGTAIVYGLLLWFLYVPSFAFQTVFFVVMGLALVGIKRSGDVRTFWLSFDDRHLAFNSGVLGFSTTIAIVFMMLGAAALFALVGTRFAAALAFQDGMKALGAANASVAIERLTAATTIDSSNDEYYRALANAKLLALRQLVAEGSQKPQADFQTKFQTATQQMITTAEHAAVLNPHDSQNWTNVGAIYQSLVPLIPGAESLALKAYDRAVELEPQNPALGFNRAVVWALVADRITQIAPRNTADYQYALNEAKRELEKSVSLKPDYAEANFLLVQVAVRQGDIASAIRSVEELRKAAPFDIGIGLQLGILYYQANRFADAETELQRVLSYDAHYANAQYFLGLTYDRTGRRTEAIVEFEKVAASNSSNQEVKTILANLHAGRPALSGILPTEKRTQPPLQ